MTAISRRKHDGQPVVRTADWPPDQYGLWQPADSTLLGNDGSGAGNYTNDHPVGINATIRDMSKYGLTFSGTAYTLTAGSQYAQFVANYGYPALAPGTWSNPSASMPQESLMCFAPPATTSTS